MLSSQIGRRPAWNSECDEPSTTRFRHCDRCNFLQVFSRCGLNPSRMAGFFCVGSISTTVCKFVLSFRRDFVSAVSDDEPSRPDHLSRVVQPTKRVVAARMEKGVIAGDQVAIQLGVTQSPKQVRCGNRAADRHRHPEYPAPAQRAEQQPADRRPISLIACAAPNHPSARCWCRLWSRSCCCSRMGWAVLGVISNSRGAVRRLAT